MLGIIIGVGAVIAAVAIGEGAAQQVQEQIANLGDNMIWIEAGGRNVSGRRTGAYGTKSLLVGDEQSIARLPIIKMCSPHVDSHVQITYKNQNWWTHYRGVAPSFLHIEHWVVASGAAFTDADAEHLAKVVILGRTVAERLFPHTDPVGKTVRIGSIPFVVVGVLQSKGASTFGQDEDDTVIMPYTTVQKNCRATTGCNTSCARRFLSRPPQARFSKSAAYCASGIACGRTRTTISSFAARRPLPKRRRSRDR